MTKFVNACIQELGIFVERSIHLLEKAKEEIFSYLPKSYAWKRKTNWKPTKPKCESEMDETHMYDICNSRLKL